MPLIPFSTLPDSARVWIFASAAPLDDATEALLLRTVDDYLAQWKAHGFPLTVGRDWREHRFLTIAVDMSEAAASGCSIDGLFRVLEQMTGALGGSLVVGGRVYYRTGAGAVACVDRGEFGALGRRGEVTPETVVFDTAVTALGDWRRRFEGGAAASWHRALLP